MRTAARRSWLIAALVSAAALVAALLCLRVTFRAPSEVTLRDPSGASTAVSLPCWSAPVSGTPSEFSLHLRKTALTPDSFVIVPDDLLVSLSVNGRELSLAGIPPEKREDYTNGFSYPLGRELDPGDNVVVVRVANRGGPGGLDVRADGARGLGAAEAWIVAASALVLLGAVMRGLRFRWTSVALALVAVAVRLAYLRVTPWEVRSHDAFEHLEYVRYLLDHHAIPRSTEGYEFYHPATYYVAAALTDAAARALGFASREAMAILQLESVVCELAFAAFGVATARLWIDRIPDAELGSGLRGRQGLLALAAALILTWPSSVLHAVRIGNDDLTYLCFGGALFFASRWWLAGREGRLRDFLVALGFAALGVVTKTNALVLFAVLGALVLARFLRERGGRLRVLLWYGAPLVAAFALSSGLALHEAIVATLAGRQDNLLVANAHLNTHKLDVGNRPINYLWFDFRAFLTNPFTSPWDDDKGRQYFWTYLLKTSLFGEWEFPGAVTEKLALVLSWMCLPMLAFVPAGMVLRWRRLVDELPLLATAVLLVTALLLIRIRLPASSGGDFRYVLPVLVPLAIGYARSVAACTGRRWRVLAIGGLGVGWLFAALSVVFVAAIAWTAS